MFPLFPEIFHSNDPKDRVPFTCQPKFPALFKQVDDVQLNLEKERSQVSALEKKQRKFDQVCASAGLFEGFILSAAGFH